MRLICTITDQQRENPYEFSYYLASQGIENECEEIPSEGSYIFRIWVYEEDFVEKAQEFYNQFKENPHDPRYRARHEFAVREQQKELNPPNSENQESEPTTKRKRRIFSPAPYGPVTILVLFTAILIFIASQFQREILIPPKLPGIVQAPILSPLERSLLFDYPTYFILRDQLFKIYPPSEIEEKSSPSPEARKLLQELRQTPVWMGIYDPIVQYFQNGQEHLSYHAPLFEKIRQGEIWRLFTPALLHIDLLHIFFNLLWLILLGNQIEFRIGWIRYSMIILITGVISNIAQYFMSGPFFMGLSGVVVGMAAFIWARQQVAPWEGYLLHRFTLMFLLIFVVGMFLLQSVFFFLQITRNLEFTIGIANTAHLIGGLTGYLLGRSRLFAIRHR
jgi:GlpG protein